MKRFFATILSIVLFISFVSCSSDNNETSSNKATSSKTQVSSEEDMISSTTEVDTRYRATREKKPDGFKYKEASILFLGDSITDGGVTPSGYRYSLFEQLYASGARFKFVGPKKSVGDIRLTDKYNSHGSTGGWTIQDLIDQVDTLCNVDYDIVLIMIGRNDSNNAEGAADRYKTLLDAVLAKNPDASIYCSDVIPKRGSNISSELINSTLNLMLPSICNEYTKKGSKVNFVQMSTATWTSDMYGDSVHPNEKGNQQIAKFFWDAILDEVLQINDSGDSNYVEPVHVDGLEIEASTLTLEENTAKTISATVTPDNAEVKNVLWSSSDEKIATVNEYGKISAHTQGKVKITAKTLDGNISKVCEVTVTKSSEPASTNVLTNTFNNASHWTGDTDFITNNGFATSWATCSSNPTIVLAKEVDVNQNFKMIFNYQVSGNVGSNIDELGGYSKILFNGYEVRIYNCVRTIELLADGTVVGKYTGIPSLVTNTYMLKVINGKVTLSFDGEEIISGNASTSGSKTITASIGDSPRCCNFSRVTISKY